MAESDLSVFYSDVLRQLLRRGSWLRKDSNILVVCGGSLDREVLLALGFTRVTVTNLDDRLRADATSDFLPYRWEYQDLDSLTYSDGSFDAVIVHSGLHHLRCPQRGINEMCRVARHGVIGFEPHRNLFTSLGVRLGVGQQYEDAAVFFNDCRWGGVANTEIPNYVVRFNKGDIRRTVQAFSPIVSHRIEFFHATRVSSRLQSLSNRGIAGRVVSGLTGVLTALGRLPWLANNMAFCIHKPRLPDELFPWLEMVGGRVTCNRGFLAAKYVAAQPHEEKTKPSSQALTSPPPAASGAASNRHSRSEG